MSGVGLGPRGAYPDSHTPIGLPSIHLQGARCHLRSIVAASGNILGNASSSRSTAISASGCICAPSYHTELPHFHPTHTPRNSSLPLRPPLPYTRYLPQTHRPNKLPSTPSIVISSLQLPTLPKRPEGSALTRLHHFTVSSASLLLPSTEWTQFLWELAYQQPAQLGSDIGSIDISR